MSTRRILISAALAVAALVVLAACTTTKTIIVQSTPNTGVKTAHQAVHQTSAVACGLLTCSHGRVGQACTVAGTRGIIVQSSPTQLACDTEGPVYPPPGAVITTTSPGAPPGQPSPVSTSAQLSSTCTTGLEDVSTTTFYSMAQVKAGDMVGPAQNYDTLAEAYQVTLTNNSANTADVTGLAVVFYDGSGTELTSSTAYTGSTFITTGQSLTFTEEPWDTYTAGNASVGPFAAGETGAVSPDDTCQLVQWYTGQ